MGCACCQYANSPSTVHWATGVAIEIEPTAYSPTAYSRDGRNKHSAEGPRMLSICEFAINNLYWVTDRSGGRDIFHNRDFAIETVKLDVLHLISMARCLTLAPKNKNRTFWGRKSNNRTVWAWEQFKKGSKGYNNFMLSHRSRGRDIFHNRDFAIGITTQRFREQCPGYVTSSCPGYVTSSFLQVSQVS